jgi:hypothetical protein
MRIFYRQIDKNVYLSYFWQRDYLTKGGFVATKERSYLADLTERINRVPLKYWVTSVDVPVSLEETILGELGIETRKILGLQRQLKEAMIELVRDHEAEHHCGRAGQVCAETLRRAGAIMKEADMLSDMFILATRHELNILPQIPISIRSNWRVVVVPEDAVSNQPLDRNPVMISIHVVHGEKPPSAEKKEVGH